MTDIRFEMLGKLSFLKDISPQVMEHLVEHAIEKSFQTGEIILHEGNLGREVLLILEGSVEVIKGQRENEVCLARSGPGQVFGEMGFLEARPRFATIRALEPTRVLELSEHSMRSALAEQPELLLRTTQILSARLREVQEQMIADLEHKNKELAQAYQELKEAQAALVIKERMQRELELAHSMQETFLPRRFPNVPGVYFAARSQPAREVGGDFYDVIQLDNQRVGLVIADVSGKGMPAALFMALTRSLIRAEARRTTSPSDVLLNTHHLLLEIAGTGNRSTNPLNINTSMFVTIFYGILDLSTHQLLYARAGHDYPILYCHKNKSTSFLRAEGALLGMFEQVFLEEAEVEMAPGDLLLLYTDGITDSTSPDGEFFGVERLRDVVCLSNNPHPQELCDCIFDNLRHFQAGNQPYDDMTLLVTRVNE